MAQTINTNVASLNAQRNLSTSQSSLGTTLQRLSSGLRVNSAKDDAAGLAISERMNTQVRGMNVAIRNANDAVSLAQTAEGALGRMGENLQRMRELSVQAANATNDTSDLTALNTEYQALIAENTRLVSATEFNGKKLLDGTAGTLTFQVGANNVAAEDRIDVATTNMTASVGAGDLTTQANAQTAIGAMDTAIEAVNAQRAVFGTAQNRFESVVANLQISSENIAAARGRIVDADFATETANLSRTQILQQAGTAMVAQANQIPQGVLALLNN